MTDEALVHGMVRCVLIVCVTIVICVWIITLGFGGAQ